MPIYIAVELEQRFYDAMLTLASSVNKLADDVKVGFAAVEKQMADQTQSMQDLTDSVQQLTTSVSEGVTELKTLADQLVNSSGDPAAVEALAQQIKTQADAIHQAAQDAATQVNPPAPAPAAAGHKGQTAQRR